MQKIADAFLHLGLVEMCSGCRLRLSPLKAQDHRSLGSDDIITVIDYRKSKIYPMTQPRSLDEVFQP